MTAAAPLIASFSAGEVSPRLAGRADLPFWMQAAALLRNMIGLPAGPAERRPGTRFAAALRDETQTAALIPFEYSTVQAYVIEAGHLWFRFYKNKAQLESAPGVPVEVASPWTAAQAAELGWCQSFDVLYLAHAAVRPKQLNRVSETAWTITDYVFNDGPYRAENLDDTKTLALTGGPPWTKGSALTLTAVGHAPFAAGHVGSLWRLQAAGGLFVWGEITGFTSTTVVTFTVKGSSETTGAVPAGLQATATAIWREGQWSDVRGWPSSVTFHQERLTFAGAAGSPWEIDASASALFNTFKPGTAAGDPLALILAGDGANAIRWLLSTDRGLVGGTSRAVFVVAPDDPRVALAPTNADKKRVNSKGAAPVRALLADTAAMFVGRHARRVFALDYSAARDGVAPTDVSLRADHLMASGIAQLAWTESPVPILWCRRVDGRLAALVWQPADQVAGWSLHTIGGAFAGGAAVVESLAVIPGAAQDELWLVVKRTIGGVTRRFVEVLDDWRTDETAQADQGFVDSGIKYSGAAATVIPGLAHLEGETVQIWADGAPKAPQAVAGGQIVLDTAAATVIAGLPCPGQLSPMPVEAGGPPGGTAQTRRKRIAKLAARLHRSAGFRAGRDAAHLDTVPLNANSNFGQAPPLFTGDVEIPFAGDWDRAGGILIEADGPGPLTVVALVPEMATS